MQDKYNHSSIKYIPINEDILNTINLELKIISLRRKFFTVQIQKPLNEWLLYLDCGNFRRREIYSLFCVLFIHIYMIDSIVVRYIGCIYPASVKHSLSNIRKGLP